MDHISKLNSIENVEKFVKDYKYDHYCLYPQKNKNSWQKYFIERLKDSISKEDTIFLTETKDRFPYMLMANIPKWDEEIFGFRVMRCNEFFYPVDGDSQILSCMIDKFVNYSKMNKVKLIVMRVHGDNLNLIHTLENKGFKYYEDIIWAVNNCSSMELIENNQIRLMEDSDIAKVMYIAENFQYARGHYHCDNNIEKEKSNSLYVKWVMTAYENKEPIVVIENNNEVAGYFVLRLDKVLSGYLEYNYGRMRSLAMDQSFRGKGLGMGLFRGAMSYMKKMGADYIDSGYASKNHVSAKLHSLNMFYSVFEETTFHLWI
jgi:L-amino acid N-acyltransferase YncA